MRRRKVRKLWALLLSGAMLTSGMPAGVWAAEVTDVSEERMEEKEDVWEAASDTVEEASKNESAEEMGFLSADEIEAFEDAADMGAESISYEDGLSTEAASEEDSEELLPVGDGAAGVVETGNCGQNLVWTLTEDGRLSITGRGEFFVFEEENIPWAGYREQITSVELAEDVTGIGGYAFSGCTNLKTVKLSEKLRSIGKYAFSGCSSLTRIEIPDQVAEIEENTFADCTALTGLVLPERVGVIGENAFRNCSAMTTVKLPEVMNRIGQGAFGGCSSLNSVFMPSQMTSFSWDAFSGCTSLTDVATGMSLRDWLDSQAINSEELSQAILHCREGIFKKYGRCENSRVLWGITLENTLRIMGEGDMPDYEEGTTPWDPYCTQITGIEIGDNVTGIGRYAFYGCIKAARVVFPDTLKRIGYCAFGKCNHLEAVDLPYGITEISGMLFYGCSRLKSVRIPEGVTSIGNSSFNSCSKLTDVMIPRGVTEIQGHAFYSCGSLKSIVLPEGLKTIEEYAFDSCINLESIEIPDSVTRMDSAVFNECRKLKNVTIPKKLTVLNSSLFYGCSALEEIEIPDGVTKIEYGAFFNCSSLKSIEIPDSVTEMYSCFSGCTSLESIEIPDSVTGMNAGFSGCTSLKSVRLPERLKEITNDMFNGCSSLESVTIPEGVTYIGLWAFYDCSNLTSIEIPDGVARIETRAFSGCSSLNRIAIPDTVTYIGDMVFDSGRSIYICYGGDEEAWSAIAVGEQNYALSNAKIHYEADAEHFRMTEEKNNSATCTKDASIVYTCKICNKSWECFMAPPLGHKEVIDAEVLPTCTKNGLTEGSHCEVCGETLKAQEVIEASGHREVFDTSEPASCTTPGWIGGSYCEVCGETLKEREEIEAPGHREIFDTPIPASCTTPGLSVGSHCEVCGEILTAQEEIPPLGHTEEVRSPRVEAMCTQMGLTEEVYCAVCGELLKKAEEIPPLGHKEVIDEGKAATCTEGGWTEGSHCEVCGETLKKAEEIPPLGHKEVIDEGKAATCTEGGWTEGSHCEVCGETLKKAEEIPALGHKEVIDEGKAATCTEGGWTEGSHCEICGITLKSRTMIAPLEHDYRISETTEASYTVDGVQVYTCSVCGNSYTVMIPHTGSEAPVIESVMQTPDGIKVLWNSVSGAAEYRVYYRAEEDETWIKAADVFGTSYTVRGLMSGTTYSFSVRCLDQAGKLSSEFSAERSGEFTAVPVISTLTPSTTGMTVKWNAVAGAEGYRVFYRISGDDSWSEAGNTKATSCTVKGLTSGKTYQFAVRCKNVSDAFLDGSYKADTKSKKFIKAPAISGVSNAASGVTVKWGAVSGAKNYRVYYKLSGAGKWSKAGDTTATSYTVKGLSSGKTYAFTVRCLNSAGTSYISAYNTTGKSLVYLAAPTVSASRATKGVKVKWNKISGASGYYVYRKVSGGSWKKIKSITSGSTVSYTDKTGKSGEKYYYTVSAYKGKTKGAYKNAGASAAAK